MKSGRGEGWKVLPSISYVRCKLVGIAPETEDMEKALPMPGRICPYWNWHMHSFHIFLLTWSLLFSELEAWNLIMEQEYIQNDDRRKDSYEGHAWTAL